MRVNMHAYVQTTPKDALEVHIPGKEFWLYKLNGKQRFTIRTLYGKAHWHIQITFLRENSDCSRASDAHPLNMKVMNEFRLIS